MRALLILLFFASVDSHHTDCRLPSSASSASGAYRLPSALSELFSSPDSSTELVSLNDPNPDRKNLVLVFHVLDLKRSLYVGVELMPDEKTLVRAVVDPSLQAVASHLGLGKYTKSILCDEFKLEKPKSPRSRKLQGFVGSEGPVSSAQFFDSQGSTVSFSSQGWSIPNPSVLSGQGFVSSSGPSSSSISIGKGSQNPIVSSVSYTPRGSGVQVEMAASTQVTGSTPQAQTMTDQVSYSSAEGGPVPQNGQLQNTNYSLGQSAPTQTNQSNQSNSTPQPVNSSTPQPVNSSTPQPLNSSTPQPLNSSTAQPSTSTQQNIGSQPSPTPQTPSTTQTGSPLQPVASTKPVESNKATQSTSLSPQIPKKDSINLLDLVSSVITTSKGQPVQIEKSTASVAKTGRRLRQIKESPLQKEERKMRERIVLRNPYMRERNLLEVRS